MKTKLIKNFGYFVEEIPLDNILQILRENNIKTSDAMITIQYGECHDENPDLVLLSKDYSCPNCNGELQETTIERNECDYVNAIGCNKCGYGTTQTYLI
jgi:hypothetical protein